MHCLRQTCSLFAQRIQITRVQSEPRELEGISNDQNEVYASVQPFLTIKDMSSIISITVKTESHDQGWASHRSASYSWGEVGFTHLENKEPYYRIRAFTNDIGNFTFQKHKLYVHCSSDEWWAKHMKAVSSKSELTLWARSQFQGMFYN